MVCSNDDGSEFVPGNIVVYLSAAFIGDSSGTCASGLRTAGAVAALPGVALSTPGSAPSSCSGSGTVSLRFPLTTTQTAGTQLTAVATPSAPSVTCTAELKTSGCPVLAAGCGLSVHSCLSCC